MNRVSPLFSAALALMLATLAQPASSEAVRLGGTGTVLGLFETLAGPFSRHSPMDTLEIIPGLGSGGAIAAVSQGAIDLAYSGRELNDKEKASGMRERPFIETPLIFVSATPEALSLTCADVMKIYSGENYSYPGGGMARLILRPRNDSSITNMINTIDGMGGVLDRARHRHDIPVAATDQDNMDMARKVSGAFTGMTLTQLRTEPNTLRHVVLDGVEPTLEAMRANNYPLKQAVSLVQKGELSPASKRFIAFLATDEAVALIDRAGAVPLQ